MILAVDEIADRANWSAVGIELRPPDTAECAAGGFTPAQALELSVAASERAYTVRSPSGLVGVWGWRSTSPNSADAWLLTTAQVPAYSLTFGRLSTNLFRDLRTTYPHLTVLCHNAHTPARRWLSWLGFTPRTILGDFTTWAT